MTETIGFAHFLAHSDAVGRIVLTLLVIGSLASWYFIVTKSLQFIRARRASQAFLKRFWEAPNLEVVAQDIRSHGIHEPFAHLLHHGFTAIDHLSRRNEFSSLIDAGAPDEMLTRALRRAIEQDKARMESGQTFLATVASSAPFVGLLGTVWGIYHALLAIGMTGQASLDKVAGPIGEALIMTAIGLAVAIPAAIAYNCFARMTRNTLTQLNSFAYDVHSLMSTGIKASALHTDARTSSDKVINLMRNQGSDGSNNNGAAA